MFVNAVVVFDVELELELELVFAVNVVNVAAVVALNEVEMVTYDAVAAAVVVVVVVVLQNYYW